MHMRFIQYDANFIILMSFYQNVKHGKACKSTAVMLGYGKIWSNETRMSNKFHTKVNKTL